MPVVPHLRKPTSLVIALNRYGSTNLALGLTRSGGGKSSRTVAVLEPPGLASCGCGTSGTLPFSEQFISHHVLQGWIKLLKTWSMFSPPEALDPANARCCA